MKKIHIFAALFLFTFIGISAQTKWTIDKSHSKVGFDVSHLVITDVYGQFKSFDASIESANPDFSDAKISFSAEIASIDTDNEKRDQHLKADDFFNSEKFPQMTFVGKSFKKISGNKYKLSGDLTIRDITKNVTLDVVLNGTVNDPRGNTKAGFKVTGKINRFDYNLKWNNLLESGGAVVGKNINITVDLQLIKS